MVVEFVVTLEFAKYRTEDIIDSPPGSDMVSLEKSPVMMITVSIEKYILRGMYIPFFEPGRSASIDGSIPDIFEITWSEIIVSLDEDGVWDSLYHHARVV